MKPDSESSQCHVRALLVGPLSGDSGGGALGAATPWPVTCPDPSLVIAVDGGFRACRSRGWETHLVVGDFDSLTPRDLAEVESQGIEVVRWPADKDFSDLDGALDEAVRRGATHITVVGVFGGRLDHQMAVMGSLARPRGVPIIALGPTADAGQPSDGDIVSILHAGDSVSVASRLTFSVMAIAEQASVSIRGARWPLDGAVLMPLSSVGLSNEALDGGGEVTCGKGAVAVIVPPQPEVRS